MWLIEIKLSGHPAGAYAGSHHQSDGHEDATMSIRIITFNWVVRKEN